jgi:hypothetical protein
LIQYQNRRQKPIGTYFVDPGVEIAVIAPVALVAEFKQRWNVRIGSLLDRFSSEVFNDSMIAGTKIGYFSVDFMTRKV